MAIVPRQEARAEGAPWRRDPDGVWHRPRARDGQFGAKKRRSPPAVASVCTPHGWRARSPPGSPPRVEASHPAFRLGKPPTAAFQGHGQRNSVSGSSASSLGRGALPSSPPKWRFRRHRLSPENRRRSAGRHRLRSLKHRSRRPGLGSRLRGVPWRAASLEAQDREPAAARDRGRPTASAAARLRSQLIEARIHRATHGHDGTPGSRASRLGREWSRGNRRSDRAFQSRHISRAKARTRHRPASGRPSTPATRRAKGRCAGEPRQGLGIPRRGGRREAEEPGLSRFPFARKRSSLSGRPTGRACQRPPRWRLPRGVASRRGEAGRWCAHKLQVPSRPAAVLEAARGGPGTPGCGRGRQAPRGELLQGHGSGLLELGPPGPRCARAADSETPGPGRRPASCCRPAALERLPSARLASSVDDRGRDAWATITRPWAAASSSGRVTCERGGG